MKEPRTTSVVEVKAAASSDCLSNWLKEHDAFVDENLKQSGAILFRGFEALDLENFDDVVLLTSNEKFDASEESSPRSYIKGNVFTSTDYPSEGNIFLHNENSYMNRFPQKLYLYCHVAADKGGESPIADARTIYDKIDINVRKKFEEKGWMLVRNYGVGPGLTLEQTFGTTDKEVIEKYCQSEDIQYKWKPDNVFQTIQVHSPIFKHPFTNENCWFNHATFFHISTLENNMGDILSNIFAKDDLPTNTYYGDGSEIQPEVLEHLREVYNSSKISFEWQKGDLLIIDNILMCHSRNAYLGERKVWFAQRDPVNRIY